MEKSFNPATHKYLIDGKPATGVTTIISVLAKPALIGWAARMATEYMENIIRKGEHDLTDETVLLDVLDGAKNAHNKKKEDAGTHGTDTHALVEEYIKATIRDGVVFDIAEDHDANLFFPVRKFAHWAIANVDHFLFAERQMYDTERFIAGTADFAYIGKDGKKYMADFKTSSGIYGIDYWLQVTAYRMLAEGEGDEPYDGATVVRMGRDGSFEVQQLNEYLLYKEAFLACLMLYRLQAHNKPEVKEKTYAKKSTN